MISVIREKLETVVPMIESGYINNILLQDDFVTYQDNYTQLLGYPSEIRLYDRHGIWRFHGKWCAQ